MIRRTLIAAAVSAALAMGTVGAYAADIVDTAVKAGQFTILAKALSAAGLVDTLKGKGPFTVFAPTDAAFKNLPKGTLDDLLLPANKAKLVKILTYHVVAGKVMSADLAGKKVDAKTVEGATVAIDATKKGVVMVNTAKVTTADIAADNGVIHVIDQVLIPN